MGLYEKIKFIADNPGFPFKLARLKREFKQKKESGKQVWVFQCDFKGHYPYLKPYYDYAKGVDNVDIYFAWGYTKNENPGQFLIDQGIPADRILDPIDYVRFLDWDVYISPTEWGNVFPQNESCLRVQIFHTLADKNMEYSLALLNFNTICANGPIHHEFLDKYVFSQFPDGKKNCRVINTGFAKIDNLFDSTYNRESLKSQLSITDDKPIILYAPNWESTSALHKYGEDVFKFLSLADCTIIVKLHYMSLLSAEDHQATLSEDNHPDGGFDWVDWRKIIGKYKREGSFILVEDQTINPYLYLADLMVTDYGGASLEYMAMNKPIIYLDCPEFFDMRGHHIFENEARNTGYLIDEPSRLPDTIHQALSGDDGFEQKRVQMARKLLYNPGEAAKTCFETLHGMVEDKKSSKPNG